MYVNNESTSLNNLFYRKLLESKALLLRLYGLVTLSFILANWIDPQNSLAPILLLVEFMPRWLVFIPLIFLIFVQFSPKQKFVLLILTIINLFVVNGLRLNLPGKDLKETLRLITFNMGASDEQIVEILVLLNTHDPDLLLLQESSDSFFVDKLPKDYSYHCDRGLCIVTKHQVTFLNSLTRRDTGSWGTFAASYELRIRECKLNVVNVHPDTPRFILGKVLGFSSNSSDTSLQLYNARELDHIRMHAWLSTFQTDIIAGDFNTNIFGLMYRKYWNEYNNAFDDSGFGFGVTYSEKLVTARIDHVLFDDEWESRVTEVLQNTGTNHSPLLVELYLPKRCQN
ncbi:endonuclease/exonuclease/phosphatase family protein [Alteromonas flava]|uniref:endonuclease/exonuclease/phosphatase family protein n=1 Tax=Alteromonas flava TaxID=2048003 RepID=UPI000C286980|nr:endonuclease/exonuclease/phosphatase family protein [Alteromonas flava]